VGKDGDFVRKEVCGVNTIGYFEIQSDDPGRAAAFYSDVFGWSITKDGSMPIEYWRIEADGMQGAILPRPAAVLPMSGTNAFCCSIRVRRFDAAAERILSHGGAVALEKMAVPGRCWQGYFLDPDGNVFGLFEPDSGAK
jgi:predicted enzyme related to lactoylglutathione lyase